MTFCENLRRVMKDRSCKAKELAEKTGITETMLRHYLNRTERREPTFNNLKAIAYALNVSCDELLGYNVPATPETFCLQRGLTCTPLDGKIVIDSDRRVLRKQVIVDINDFPEIAEKAKREAAPYVAYVEAAAFLLLAGLDEGLTEGAKDYAVRNYLELVCSGDNKETRDAIIQQIEADKAAHKAAISLRKTVKDFANCTAVKTSKDAEKELIKEGAIPPPRLRGLNRLKEDIQQLQESIAKKNKLINELRTARVGRINEVTDEVSLLTEMCTNLLRNYVKLDKGVELSEKDARKIVVDNLQKKKEAKGYET